MRFETWMLRGLFAACLAVCALTLGAMLNAAPPVAQWAATGRLGTILLAAPTSCALPQDGVICPRHG
ncbi:MAG: hypothetical protein KGJ97_07280 [Xanthomonadaceae bacterium]|jgi:hypothetical protein|nr:hypothetical protein [Xanthomonadaceae bacterium]MDE3072319.1 hypothetical protein [Pseudomonadota bacterium]